MNTQDISDTRDISDLGLFGAVSIDPQGTPLNVRSEPNGPIILGTLNDGAVVELRKVTIDSEWVFVVPSGGGPKGWVFRTLLSPFIPPGSSGGIGGAHDQVVVNIFFNPNAIGPIGGQDPSGQGSSTTGGVGNSTLTIHGLVFNLFLTHNQVQTIVITGTIAASVIPSPPIQAAVLLSASFLNEMDHAGGNQGVDISGVLGTSQLLITPHGMFNIFRAVKIVQDGAQKFAQQVADETSATATQVVQGIAASVHEAGNAGAHAQEQITGFFQHL